MKLLIHRIQLWFKSRGEVVNKVIQLEASEELLYNELAEISKLIGEHKGTLIERVKELREDLIYKVSQERAAEILAIKSFEDTNKPMNSEVYKSYLEEAEQLYKLRPWRDIVKKLQYDQLQFIMLKSDGGDIGQLQQLISRGAILFADHAERELTILHTKYLDISNGNKPLEEDEKYLIFS